MEGSERKKIKKQILQVNRKKWWGDDFDVRFYLISQLKKTQNQNILDIGGGIGIILSNVYCEKLKVNLDLSLEDLKIAKRLDPKIDPVCASITNIPFKDNAFDCLIAANILEVAKDIDLSTNQVDVTRKLLRQIRNIVKKKSRIFLTTPNNAYYKTRKFTYNELNELMTELFLNFKIYFFNTYPKLSDYSRKLNLANSIPKLKSYIKNDDIVISHLCRKKSKNNYSVSFYIEIKT